MKLGKLVSNIRSGYSYSDKRAELEPLGIAYKVTEAPREFTFPVIKAALIRYNELYGTFNVAPKFTIAKTASLWPPEMAGMRLGHLVKRFRSGEWVTSAEERQFFADIGIVPDAGAYAATAASIAASSAAAAATSALLNGLVQPVAAPADADAGAAAAAAAAAAGSGGDVPTYWGAGASTDA